MRDMEDLKLFLASLAVGIILGGSMYHFGLHCAEYSKVMAEVREVEQ